jgi:catechol 2,3-dioxygenase-like lactoylglutathione lyase family enzyme
MNLNQVTLPATDVAEATAFYRKMGFRLIMEALPGYVRFQCLEGEATFSLHRVERLSEGEGTYVYFECEELDKTVASLQERGIMFDELPTDKRWLWREARLKDPAGNELILYHAGKNRKFPPWRLET